MQLPPISLDAGWVCEYFELRPDLYEFAKDVLVSSLAAWTFDRIRSENWAAWLRRRFTLEPLDTCVQYYLYIDTAPANARIYVNNRHVADYIPPGPDDPPFELDITADVALGENMLAFRVECDAPGCFSGVRLQPVPCD